VIQAEDELAAIGMVLGAGWAGARSMTATSGPGMSLMAEFCGLGYLRRDSRRHHQCAAHRALDWHAHAHQQADLLSAAFLSHATPNTFLLCPFSQGVLRADHGGLRSGRAGADPGFVLSDTVWA